MLELDIDRARSRSRTCSLLAQQLATDCGAENVLEALGDVMAIQTYLTTITECLVRHGRSQGISWTELAGAMHVSRQALHRKYASNLPYEEEIGPEDYHAEITT